MWCERGATFLDEERGQIYSVILTEDGKAARSSSGLLEVIYYDANGRPYEKHHIMDEAHRMHLRTMGNRIEALRIGGNLSQALLQKLNVPQPGEPGYQKDLYEFDFSSRAEAA